MIISLQNHFFLMSIDELIVWVRKHLDGIDRCEDDDDGGWWQTADGALFGHNKLRELESQLRLMGERGRLSFAGVTEEPRSVPSLRDEMLEMFNQHVAKLADLNRRLKDLEQIAPPAKEENIDRSQISDGYHTFAELYDHRHSLVLALMRALPHLCWFSQRHHDGELPFGSADWFIVGAELPSGAITYHLPIELLPLAQQTGAVELTLGRPWDGHTASDVIERLRAWVGSPQFAPPGEVPPSGYAYRYPDGIRFNGGGEVNACRPIEAMPYWFSPPVSATPPAEGEAAELVEFLQAHDSCCEDPPLWRELLEEDGVDAREHELMRRAAELLQQRHPAPVAVSEQPGPKDCNTEGLCWVWNRTAYTWGLFRLDLTAHSHWLPAHALPLPAGEEK